MAVTAAFTVNPKSIRSGQTFKFYNRSDTSAAGEEITAYSWEFVDGSGLQSWTVTSPPSTRINITNASTYFSVNDMVAISTTTPPTGLSDWPTVYYVVTANTTYLELSASLGGAAITYTGSGSGALYIFHASNLENPEWTPKATATNKYYSVRLSVYGTTTGWVTSGISLGFVLGTNNHLNKPSTEIFDRTSVFLYNGDNATLLNRSQTTNNNLIYHELVCSGSINSAGTATIKVWDIGDATATETLLVSNGYSTETNVAIMVGYDIVWSGRILRATQEKMSQYDETTLIREWVLECESDIQKMGKQNINDTNCGNYYAKIGERLDPILDDWGSGDIDWNDYGLSSFEGPKVQVRVPYPPKDMYSTFSTFMKVSGFDWRTQLSTWRFTYSTYVSATKIITPTTMTNPADALIGGWVIFVDPTQTYPTAYGRITDNDTTTITCTTITNSGVPPSTNSQVVVFTTPHVDYAMDISEASPVVAFTANQSESATLGNIYEFNDKTDKKSLVTKIVVTSKDRYLDQTNTMSISATTPWNSISGCFDHATYMTQKTEGWVKSGPAAGSYLYLYGSGYVLQVNDEVDVCYYDTAGTLTVESFHLHAIDELVDDDGNTSTRLTLNVALSHGYPAGTFMTCRKLYVKDPSQLSTGTETRVGIENITLRDGGTDAVYGPYLTTTGISDRGESSTLVYPHITGCLMIDDTYTEASPHSGSPVSDYGLMQRTVNVDTVATLSELEVYATLFIISNSTFYKRATCWCHPYDFCYQDVPYYESGDTRQRFLREGQRVSISTTTGDTAVEYQIVAWTYTANELKIDMTLGDYDRNVFTLVNDKTNALDNSLG